MITRRLAAPLLAALLACPLVASAQKIPKRPKLPAAADTNDAHAYYNFAVDQLRIDPEASGDALYWATRLDPTWAEAFYARRIALLLADKRRLLRYWSGDRRTIQSNDVKRIDSLFFHALTLNPFVPQLLERSLYEAVVEEITREYANAGYNPGDVRYEIERATSNWPASERAWLAYGEGRYDDALSLFAKAIRDNKKNGPLRVDRARIFYNKGEVDSARAELTVAVEDQRKRDKKELIYVYQSKALTEHSLGLIEQRLGHADAAKEAYGRALQEDLSYYPAHVQLAFMALEAHDTTTALSEMELATQLRADDPATRYLYGFTLASSGKSAEAETQLRKALELEPFFAPVHFALAQVLEQTKRSADARDEYRAFLEHSAKSDLRRADAERRLAGLGAGGDARR
jgi:Flp pilus assembly protein TadD